MKITITEIQTFNDKTGKNEIFFNPLYDPLKLVVYYNLSADIVNVNADLSLVFEIVDFQTNKVVVNQRCWYNYVAGSGSSWFAWVGSPTPHDWGLVWTGGDVFGFRVAVEVSINLDSSGYNQTGTVAVSETRWFRVQDIFTL